MEVFDREPYGSVPIWTGAEKPRLFLGVDPRVFAPIVVLIAIGVFSRSFLSVVVFFSLAAAIYVAGKILGSWSPYFIDEFTRWLDRRSRTGSTTLPADAYFHGLDSPDIRRWRDP